MRPPRPVLSIESPFAIEELFFSTTDHRGIISTGNEVFRRVSEYDFTELIGEPHNIIRHPDMPRAVFKILWDYLEQKKTIAAFVKNRSKSGKYYWVVAYVVPVDQKYLSIRFKPTTELLEVVTTLYREVAALESAREQQGESRKQAVKSAEDFLLQKLAELGFDSYDSFMHHALVMEFEARSKLITRSDRQESEIANSSFGPLFRQTAQADEALVVLFEQLSALADANGKFKEISLNIVELSDEMRLSSMNAAVEASRLGEHGRVVTVIAQFLGSGSGKLASEVRGLSSTLNALMPRVRQLMFDVCASKLQIEMIQVFLKELAGQATGRDAPPSAVAAQIEILLEAFCSSTQHTLRSVTNIGAEFQSVSVFADEVYRAAKQLSFGHVTGKVESEGLPAGSSFSGVLDSVSSSIAAAQEKLQLLSQLCASIIGGFDSCKDEIHGLEANLSALGLQRWEQSGPPAQAPGESL